MWRKMILSVFSLLVISGLALAQATQPAQPEKAAAKELRGTVKSVAMSSLTVTDDTGKDWTFAITESTTVVAKGASHKMKASDESGKPAMITDFVKEKQNVSVKYSDVGGKLQASEIRVQ